MYTQYFPEFCENKLQANHSGGIQTMTFALLEQGQILWLCLPPKSALTISIPRLRASAEFMRWPCMSRMPSNAEYAPAAAKSCR